MASPSRVCAFSRTSSASRAACQVAISTTGGLPGRLRLALAGVGGMGVLRCLVSCARGRACRLRRPSVLRLIVPSALTRCDRGVGARPPGASRSGEAVAPGGRPSPRSRRAAQPSGDPSAPGKRRSRSSETGGPRDGGSIDTGVRGRGAVRVRGCQRQARHRRPSRDRRLACRPARAHRRHGGRREVRGHRGLVVARGSRGVHGTAARACACGRRRHVAATGSRGSRSSLTTSSRADSRTLRPSARRHVRASRIPSPLAGRRPSLRPAR